jgi:predicted HicB family RNase H-like nuclease
MSKGTPARNIRIPDDLWTAAKAKAADKGTTVSELVVEFLTRLVSK